MWRRSHTEDVGRYASATCSFFHPRSYLFLRSYTADVRRRLLLLIVFVVGCGGSSPVGPGPAPAPVTATDSVTGQAIPNPITTLLGAGRIRVEASGYLTRETRSAASVDLIPAGGPFDLTFYRQLARGTLEGEAQPLRVLSAAPSIYLQTAGLSAANVAALEQAARAAVPALTGGRFQVTRWETGPEARPEQAGWIVVEMVNEPDTPQCGRAFVDAAAGHVWINLGRRSCNRAGTLTHELGHALGFYHVAPPDGLMSDPTRDEIEQPSSAERYHAALAYKRTAGNRDPDIDP